MTLFERTLCVTMIVAVVLVLGFAIVRPASRSGSQVAPSSAPPVRPSSGRLPASPTGTPDRQEDRPGVHPAMSGPAGDGAVASGVPPSQSPPAAAEVRVTTASARRVNDGKEVRSVSNHVGSATEAGGLTRRVTGLASWYCRPPTSRCTRGYPASGLYAAAGATLRVGNWRGRYVYVTAGLRTVRIRLVDYCSCSRARVLDLYTSVWRALGMPLSRGVIQVKVSW